MSQKLLSFLFIFALVLLAGCDSATPTVSVDPTNAVQTQPTDETITTSIPTPSSDQVGIVTGVLKVDKTNPSPADKAILYLGEILKNTEGTPQVASFDRKTSISTQTDANGTFVFTDVPPGTYVLILDRISDSFMLSNPDTGNDLYVIAGGGEITDLGELVYSELPIP